MFHILGYVCACALTGSSTNCFSVDMQPLVSGAALGLEGQVCYTWVHELTSIYLCLKHLAWTSANYTVGLLYSWQYTITKEVRVIDAYFQLLLLQLLVKDARIVEFLELVCEDNVSVLQFKSKETTLIFIFLGSNAYYSTFWQFLELSAVFKLWKPLK